jgi:hypothetical protein
MVALTIIYPVLGVLSIFPALMGFMFFDSGVTTETLTMFIIVWLFPICFFMGTGLAWLGFGTRSRYLMSTGVGLPFLALAIFCVYVGILLYLGK